MKYLKYGIGLIGACTIVSASVVAPFSIAGWFEDLGDSAEAMYEVATMFADWVGIYVGEEIGSYACIVTSYNGDEVIHHVRVTGTQEWSNYNQVRYYFNQCWEESKTNFTGYKTKGSGYVDVYPNRINIHSSNYYFDQSSHSNYVIYCDLPSVYASGSDNITPPLQASLNANPSKVKTTPNTAPTFIGNVGLVVKAYEPEPPTSPANTTPAPGFPNLPNDWVNGGGDVDIKIDLPDIDFNLPDLPDYTLPSAPSIPEQFQTGISTVIGKIWDIVVQSGLVWLVVFSLTCSLIIYILSR